MGSVRKKTNRGSVEPRPLTNRQQVGIKIMILKRDIRIQFIMAPEELAAIDDFRFARRMPNRSAAVRELVSSASHNAQ